MAHCIPVSLSNPGGVEKHILSLSSALRRLGVDVEVYCTPDGNGMVAGCRPLNEFRAVNFDILHTHSGFYCRKFLYGQLWRRPGQRWVHTLHNSALEYMIACRWWGNWRCYYSSLVEGHWARYADHIIAVSRQVKTWTRKCFYTQPEKITVIPNGRQPSEANSLPDRTTLRKRLGVSPENIVVLFIGRCEDRVKNADFVHNGIKALYARRPEVRLLAIPGTSFPAAPWLRTTGIVPHEDIVAYCRAADIFVNASLSEGLPLTLVEAMAAGLPVIAAPVGGIPDIVQHEKNGLLLRPDGNDLLDLLGYLMDNPAQRDRLGSQARRDVEYLTWDQLARHTLEIYRTILNGSAAFLRRKGNAV
ncbi:MAG: glycosyltransferase family 4 protein [Sedimentisphaerales bacterium]|nr:glycosyltransferase family 4 protein [Sedimentisphaerales bacterium]